MKLRKLRLCGFKSFADKTEFDFGDGITVVVGPNGCGKSNVVDGVKWTLGEQSAKSLRGKEMMDVVFNGAAGRKAAAFAETVLVFDNGAGLLRTELKTVEVSRRLYRSGESEYLINRQVSRLRDVKELFMGTGVGVDAYSVIEQGKVDILLAANPFERRLIFEEAAGISRLKAKKKEALRKLEKCRANLARLTDITEEVARRLRSVKIQAGKARSYREYSERLKQLRVRWSLAEYHRRKSEGRGAVEALAAARARREALAAEFEAMEAERSAAAALLAEADRELAEQRMQAADVRAKIAAVEDRIGSGRRRLEELAEETARDRTAYAEGRRGCADLLRRAENEQDETAALAARVTERQAELAALQQRQQARRAEAVELAERIERQKAEVVEWVRRLTRLNNESAALEVHRRNLADNRERLARRADELAREIDGRRAEREFVAAEVERLGSIIAQRDGERTLRKSEAESVTARTARLGEELASARSELSRVESRRAVLTELETQLEGVDAGVREVLKRARAEGAGSAEAAYGSVRGMVADFVRAGSRYAPMIEAALGRHLQSLVVGRSDRLLSKVQELRDIQGQAHFFCVDRLPERHDGLRLDGEPEYVGRPMDFLEAAPEVRPVAEYLLARTIVVKSAAGALSLVGKVPAGYRFVTLDGQVVGHDGSVEVGTAVGRCGLLSRKSELRELEQEVRRAADRAESVAKELDEACESARFLERAQQDLRTAIYEAATAQADRRSRLESLDQELGRLSAEQPALTTELAGIDADLLETSRREAAVRQCAEELEAGRAAAQARAEALVAEHERTAAEEAALAAQVADLRVEVSRVQQQKESFAEQAAQLTAARRQAEESLEAALARIDRNRQRAGEMAAEVLGGEAERASLYAARDEAEARVRTSAAQRAGLPERVEELTGRSRPAAVELNALTEGVHKLEMQCSEAEVRLENLVARARDDFGMDLPTEYERLLNPPTPQPVETAEPVAEPTAAAGPVGGGPAAAGADGAGASASEAAQDSPQAQPTPQPPPAPAVDAPPTDGAAPAGLADLEATDWNAVQEEINELKGKIERLGNVNLDAVDELEELERRNGRLEKHARDLQDADKRLEDLIGRINRDSAALFLKTFADVRANFQELFRKLFGGGKADVFLEDENNPLECGIEILARPPGKETRSISLLSGGEKTMTAVAMLLAVFRSRPSPFCILDEVDAALDEANTHRFAAVVKEFSTQSQFIVITHRKPTMTVADVMYGVTMEQTGVSKKVAVRFNDHGEVVSGGDDGRESAFTFDGPKTDIADNSPAVAGTSAAAEPAAASATL